MDLSHIRQKAVLPKSSAFHTKTFQKQCLSLAQAEEYIVRGSRDLFSLLPQAFKGIRQIGVIGWSSQGPAQAQNIRDSLVGTNITVKVGLRESSSSTSAAERAGFTRNNGTLDEMYQVISESDFVLLLISDAAQAEMYQRIFAALRPKSTRGLSHGFLLGHLRKMSVYFPNNVNVVAVCPKGMGLSVRRLYQQGVDINGVGINCSFAVEQDVTGMATDYALGWAIALGSPVTFQTTLRSEYLSDLVGERGILLGAVHGITESLYRWFMQHGFSAGEALIKAVESITGPISRMVSEKGILSVFQSMDDKDKETFRRAFSTAYMPAFDILLEIYDEVSSGNEISSVTMAHKRHQRFPMGKIDGTDMWKVGKEVREKGGTFSTPIHPVTAGLHLATMMAQVDLLKEKGHPYSEIANESVIEAVDSLNPYMHHKGVSFMVDNCSTTGKLGARKWAPRFDYILTQQVLVTMDEGNELNASIFDAFWNNDIHEVLTVCAQLRPPVNIAVIDA
ncbi:unnamed protein product [Didymodactylos carnosus]|uniref:Acetohydroxy-acid reductoisomerase n=1 Tax=Didymodactylos carnosus TaxID=1234261 RepID=A0A8S2DAJ8_9BILA|nr:unnamed protein product [Didymodactylos carnosus]CAF3632193.1 unnamed protein product [Didymodactylos carnosus]